jgi:hypothetical protein
LSVRVTLAVDAVVFAGVYLTAMVQVPPAAAITIPDAQLPPAIENLLAVVPTVLVMVGAAVSVSAPVPVLVTVIAPFFTVMSAGLDVSAGDGAEKVTAAWTPVPDSGTDIEQALGDGWTVEEQGVEIPEV